MFLPSKYSIHFTIRNKHKLNYTEFYKKFWSLQEILCNRDYLVKDPNKWHSFKHLVEDVLQEMEKIKDVIQSEEKNLNDMSSQLSVVMQEVEETSSVRSGLFSRYKIESSCLF